MSDGGNTVPRITKAEHIGPSDTGDNIDAKRVAGYVWNPTGGTGGTGGWERMTQPGGGGSIGTQYTDGASTVAHPIGTIPVYDKAGTITAVSVANPLPVAATFSGSLTTAPTFAQNPGAGTPTPAFGLVDSSFRPQVSVATALPAGANAIGSVAVSNFPVTQPVSGTVAVSNFPASQAVTGTFWQTTQPVSGPLTDTQLRATPVPVSGTVATGGLTDTQLRATPVPISGSLTNISGTVSLPTGASTSALQTTGNTSVGSIDTKTPALGQALAAASVPVVLPAAQITTLTPQTNALTDTQLRATPVPISGTVTATTGGLTDTQLRATAVPVSLATAPTTPVTGTFWQATQPVSVAATLAVKETQPTGSAVTSVANSVTSVTLLASNTSRRQATIYNDDTLGTGAILKVKLGAAASATSFTIPIAPGGYYELPQPVYTGVIDAIASAATGSARITELS